jgi:hypothetical protein
MRASSIVLSAVAVSLLYPLAASLLAGALHGVIREGNNWLPVRLATLAGQGALWLAALVAAVSGVRAIFRGRYSLAGASGIAALLCFASPLVTRPMFLTILRKAELRDLEQVGLPALRTEAASLVASDWAGKYPSRWMGREVPPAKLPPALRRLSARAAYVAITGDGVVLAMDGLGGWRGGYMITPPDSSFVPPQSRQITEGVFYVVAQ